MPNIVFRFNHDILIYCLQALLFSRSDPLGNLLVSSFDLMRSVLVSGLHSQVSILYFRKYFGCIILIEICVSYAMNNRIRFRLSLSRSRSCRWNARPRWPLSRIGQLICLFMFRFARSETYRSLQSSMRWRALSNPTTRPGQSC